MEWRWRGNQKRGGDGTGIVVDGTGIGSPPVLRQPDPWCRSDSRRRVTFSTQITVFGESPIDFWLKSGTEESVLRIEKLGIWNLGFQASLTDAS